MRLLHAADLHIDSPLRGLSRYDGAPVERVRGATRHALTHLVEVCLAQSVDAVLLAGDVFDGDWQDYSTGLFFAKQMSRLREAEVPVFLVRGNHDAFSKMTRNLRLPENVVELSVEAPETRVVERLGLAVHGQGFARREVFEDLSRAYPERREGYFNVGLLHTSLEGRPGHDPYAPCTVAGLVAKGYDYWALGHVHAREIVHEAPYVVYPGNLQGRHARETGAKGATLVTVEGGFVRALDHVALDSVRWAHLAIDLAPARSVDDALEAARAALGAAVEEAGGRLLAARVELAGATSAHASLLADRERLEGELRALANDFGDAAWIEKVVLRPRADRGADDLRRRDDALGRLARGVEALRSDDAALRELAEAAGLVELAGKLPLAVKAGEDGLRLDDLDVLRGLLAEAEATIAERIGGDGS